MTNKTLNALVEALVWGTLITGVLLLSQFGHCSTTSSRENSLGTISYKSNPLMYLAASLSTNGNAVDEIDGNLNLRLKPVGTYMLYDESILFCGYPTDKFEGVKEPFLLTYERVSHHNVQGVGCHNLVRVDTVVLKKERMR
jgi:hypothetical protein